MLAKANPILNSRRTERITVSDLKVIYKYIVRFEFSRDFFSVVEGYSFLDSVFFWISINVIAAISVRWDLSDYDFFFFCNLIIIY